MHYYLIRRGERPVWHNAPWTPVLVCANKQVAKWEAGATDARCWVWSHNSDPHSGWLLERWNGLDIDYGHIIRGMPLPDGRTAAFEHPYEHDRPAPYSWDILNGAVWWSTKPLPDWLRGRGVVETQDDWTLRRIREHEEEARRAT